MANADIGKYHVQSGRVLKEDNTYINWANYFQITDGLPYAVFNGDAGLFSTTITLDPNQSAAINLFFDNKTVLSKVLLPINNITPITRVGLATGDYSEILTSSKLNLVDPFVDNSQAQVVLDAVADGLVLGGNSVENAIVTNGDNPINVSFTNTTAETIRQDIIIKFFDLDQVGSLTLIQADTQLESDTEMSTYG